MKIGIISDTHISGREDSLPKKVLEEFKNVDMIIHAGDFVNLRVLEQLSALCGNVKAVWGNMDPDEIKNTLPQNLTFKIGKYKICLTHGHGHPKDLMDLMISTFKEEKPDIIIFGHSHVGINEKKGGILYFNPGSPTDKVFAPYNSFGIIEVNDKIEAKIIKI